MILNFFTLFLSKTKSCPLMVTSSVFDSRILMIDSKTPLNITLDDAVANYPQYF